MRPKLYGRAYCHLCEEMALALRALGVEFDEIDVDADPALEARFGERVPVLTDARDHELCHYRLDPAVARKLIPEIK
ncbi:MAG TPA: glutaredoxin family protein [Burkholderiales bacterium]|nr:glutaredoxin family protein [Burkholderiales bacterium]